MPSPRVRIAPSPTGDPHVGTAYVALFNLAFARKHEGGKFLLRIEDTDRVRSTRASEEMIFEALRWLGLQYDEGPDVGGPCGPYRQSERSEHYRQWTGHLVERGAAYLCFCTPQRLDEVRKIQQAAKQPTKYDGHCRHLPADEGRRLLDAGTPHVVRLKVPVDGETRFTDLIRGEIVIANAQLDDQVLMKSDGFPTYHLANVVDDHLMGITHVMRAEEWIPSTPKHILLYAAFGWEPPKFAHVPLLRNPDKSKIAKRKAPTSLRWYALDGYLPEALLNFLALQGFSMPGGTEVFTFDEMAANFDFPRITTSGPVFDLKKLDWLNGMYIRKLTNAELADWIAGAILAGAGSEAERILKAEGLGAGRVLQHRGPRLQGIELPVRLALHPPECEAAAKELDEAVQREKEGKGGLDPRYAERVRQYLTLAQTDSFRRLVERVILLACKPGGIGMERVAGLIRERMTRLTWDELLKVAECFLPGQPDYDAALLTQRVTDPLKAVEALERTDREIVPHLTSVPLNVTEERAAALAESLGLPKGDFFMLLRVAVTGKTATPPLFETMEVLGSAVVSERLGLAAKKLRRS
ncbi:MAG: glutamate--tRNA ligase [Planctomycetes bacterium]|nr:glutamate--tRNA ligase [Planctomycetota bacterium]